MTIMVTNSARSPLTRLVLFMVCLSIAGALVAGVHYVAVDLPQQQAVQAPTNSYDHSCCQLGTCQQETLNCQSRCAGNGQCALGCYLTYHEAGNAC